MRVAENEKEFQESGTGIPSPGLITKGAVRWIIFQTG